MLTGFFPSIFFIREAIRLQGIPHIGVRGSTNKVNDSKGFRDCKSFFNLITYDTEQHLYLMIHQVEHGGGKKTDNNNNATTTNQATSFFSFWLASYNILMLYYAIVKRG